MSYISTNSIVFPLPIAIVFGELTTLDRYPQWNSGMIRISKSGAMHIGMLFETESVVLGQRIKSLVEVARLTKNQDFELVNNTGAITYRALFRFIEVPPGQVEVTCTIQFEFKSFILRLAKPTIEATASSRIKSDLELLRTLMVEQPGDMKERSKLEA